MTQLLRLGLYLSLIPVAVPFAVGMAIYEELTGKEATLGATQAYEPPGYDRFKHKCKCHGK